MGNSTSESKRFTELAAATSVRALRRSSTKLLNDFLSKKGQLFKGRLNNYEGLAELAGLIEKEIEKVEKLANKNKVPVVKVVLDMWQTKWEKMARGEPKILHLWNYLKILGHQDALKECQQIILEDIKVYNESQRPPSPDVPTPLRIPQPRVPPTPRPDMLVTVPISTFKYAVFINCSEDDEHTALEFVRLFENKYSLKAYFTPRDEIPGVILYDDRAETIETRCAKMLCFVTREFEESQACQFATQYAFHLGPGVRESRIVPVILEANASCPRVLSHLSKVDLSSCQKDTEQYTWAFERLIDALKSPICAHASRYPTSSHLSPLSSSRQPNRTDLLYQRDETAHRSSSDTVRQFGVRQFGVQQFGVCEDGAQQFGGFQEGARQFGVPVPADMNRRDDSQSALDSGYNTERESWDSRHAERESWVSRQSSEDCDSGYLLVGRTKSSQGTISRGNSVASRGHEDSYEAAQFFLSPSTSVDDGMESMSENDTRTVMQDQMESTHESITAVTSHATAILHDADAENTVARRNSTSTVTALERSTALNGHATTTIHDEDTESTVARRNSTSTVTALEDDMNDISLHTSGYLDNDDKVELDSILGSASESSSAKFIRYSTRHRNEEQEASIETDSGLENSTRPDGNERPATSAELDDTHGDRNEEVLFV